MAELQCHQCGGVGLVCDDQDLRPNSSSGKWADAEALADLVVEARRMKPQDIFKLAVRFLGLVFLYQGLQTLPSAAIQFFAVLGTNSGMMLPTLVTAGWPLLVAFWLLRGAPPLMHIAYPDAHRGTNDNGQV